MPESPEVRIITEQLNKLLMGQKLCEVNILGGKFIKHPPDHLDLVQKDINNSSWPVSVKNVSCKGKFIWFSFINSGYLFNSLGMTGSWTQAKEKHSAIELKFENFSVYFTDPRRFGNVNFYYGDGYLENKLSSLGLDILDAALNKKNIKREFYSRLGSLDKNIAQALMDQYWVSGIGNYIKAEGLYRAKISPWRRCNKISKEEYEILLNSLSEVMVTSYHCGGATLATYKHIDGTIGQFGSLLQVYGKLADHQGRPIIKEITPDKRTTWWCPEVQR